MSHCPRSTASSRSPIHSLPSSLKPWFSSHHPLFLTCFQMAFPIVTKKKKPLIPFPFQLAWVVYTTLYFIARLFKTICCAPPRDPTAIPDMILPIFVDMYHSSFSYSPAFGSWPFPLLETLLLLPFPSSPGGLSTASTSHLSFRLHVDKSSKFEFLKSQGTHQINYDKIP